MHASFTCGARPGIWIKNCFVSFSWICHALLLPSEIGEEGTDDGDGGQEVLLAAATTAPLAPVVVPALPVPVSTIVAPGSGSTTTVGSAIAALGPGSTGLPVPVATAGVTPGSTARDSREAQTTAGAEIDETR